jgi:prepilin-type N-terminal cleavage/methylation domain-containing protein
MRNNKGFSLIELLVSILIIGLLAAIGLSLTRDTVRKTDVSAAFNGFLSDYNYARQLAARENRIVGFKFDSLGNSYSIMKLRGITLDWTLTASYDLVKTVTPTGKKDAFIYGTGGGACDFSINSMGMIQKYPIDPLNPSPKISLYFFAKASSSTSYQKTTFEKRMTLFPSGGYKIENK